MEVQFNKPAVYTIRVQGKLGDEWSGRLGGMQITQEEKKGAKTISTLTGRIIDQSALSGVLNTLYELHLPVLSVNILEDN
jgi:hypothetical protein